MLDALFPLMICTTVAFLVGVPLMLRKTCCLSFLAQIIFQERVMRFRREEYDRRRAERDLQIQQMLQARRQEREALRKKIFYVQNEEEKQRKMHEVEEARKLEGTF